MVTKRARLWIRRGTAMAGVIAVLVAGGATWYYAGVIESDLLTIEFRTLEPNMEVVAVSADTVTLPASAETSVPGTWGLDFRGGHATVGEVVSATDSTIERRLVAVDGLLTSGTRVAMDDLAFGRDPSDRGIAHAEVLIGGPLGAYPSWQVSGGDDTWVIFVHGKAENRRQALRAMGTVHELDLPMLAITYRNDIGAPASENQRSALGSDEWRDLEAAVRHALDEGARDVVIVGYGMGATLASLFLHESELSGRVAALVMDSPLLDVGVTVDVDATSKGVPGFLTGWAKALATFRFGVDWTELDQVSRADEFQVPVLLFHGEADDQIAIRSSDAFAEALPRLVTYLRSPNAGHAQSWNVAPSRYESALRSFLTDAAVGQSDLPAVSVDR